MPKMLIVYDSRDGVVYGMAKEIAEGMRGEGVAAELEDVTAADPRDLLKYDGFVVGTPCYMANMSGKLKEFLDGTWGLRGKLDGKVGAAFGSERHLGGGAEHALRSVHAAMMLHGMVVQGDVEGGPFGAIALDPSGRRDDVVAEEGGQCRRMGARLAALVKKLAGQAVA